MFSTYVRSLFARDDSASVKQAVGFRVKQVRAPDEPDEEAIWQMECGMHGALLRILRKHENGELLTRAEWGFLGRQSYRTYDRLGHKISTIDGRLLEAHLRAFASVIALRDREHAHKHHVHDDGYYAGNLNASWIKEHRDRMPLREHIRHYIEGLSPYVSAGAATFSSRNLDCALQSEPSMDITRLNTALRPHLRSLLVVGLYGYWTAPQTVENLRENSPTQSATMLHDTLPLPGVRNEHFCISVHATRNTVSCAIEALKHSFVFSLNNYHELMGFISVLMGIDDKTIRTFTSDFALHVPLPGSSRSGACVMLEFGRWRQFLTFEEFLALKQLFQDFCRQSPVASHLGSLELMFGRV
jgi:hypothetical protein